MPPAGFKPALPRARRRNQASARWVSVVVPGLFEDLIVRPREPVVHPTSRPTKSDARGGAVAVQDSGVGSQADRDLPQRVPDVPDTGPVRAPPAAGRTSRRRGQAYRIRHAQFAAVAPMSSNRGGAAPPRRRAGRAVADRRGGTPAHPAASDRSTAPAAVPRQPRCRLPISGAYDSGRSDTATRSAEILRQGLGSSRIRQPRDP